MPVPNTIADLSTTANSNFPQDSDLTGSTVASLPRNLSAIIKKQYVRGSDIDIVATGVVTVPDEGPFFVFTGTGFNITGLSTPSYNGRMITVKFLGAFTLVHSSSFVMPGAVNMAVVSGSVASFVYDGSGVWTAISGTAIGSFPTGTKMPFYQAAPPVGWTATAIQNDSMMRVVTSGTTGGTSAAGAGHSPILMNIVPSHTHGFTTLPNGAHSHDLAFENSGVVGSIAFSVLRASSITGASTQFMSPVADHTHTGTTNANTGSANWQPRYMDFCVGTKS